MSHSEEFRQIDTPALRAMLDDVRSRRKVLRDSQDRIEAELTKRNNLEGALTKLTKAGLSQAEIAEIAGPTSQGM